MCAQRHNLKPGHYFAGFSPNTGHCPELTLVWWLTVTCWIIVLEQTSFEKKYLSEIYIWFFAGRMEAYSFFYLSMSVWKFVLMYNITHWVIIFLAASLTCLQIDFTWLAVTHTDSLTGTHLRPQYQHNNAMVMTSAEWSLVKIDSWWTITVGFMMYLKISCPPHMLALMSLTVKY